MNEPSSSARVNLASLQFLLIFPLLPRFFLINVPRGESQKREGGGKERQNLFSSETEEDMGTGKASTSQHTATSRLTDLATAAEAGDKARQAVQSKDMEPNRRGLIWSLSRPCWRSSC